MTLKAGEVIRREQHRQSKGGALHAALPAKHADPENMASARPGPRGDTVDVRPLL